MAHIERTRAVVEENETHDGKIIPTEQAELARPVRIRSDATVKGSIYGGTVEVHEEALVQGSVMASEAIELNDGHVENEVGTSGKVTGKGGRVSGTVTGKRIRLTECIVTGNVVGAEIILENCIVLGLVAADRHLELKGTLCYTFRAQGDTSLEDATLVLPQAIANGSIEFETPVSVVGLGELSVDNNSDSNDENEELPKMTEKDLYEQQETTYLTLAPRILNLEKVTDRLDELESNIMTVVDNTIVEIMDIEDFVPTTDIDNLVSINTTE